MEIKLTKVNDIDRFMKLVNGYQGEVKIVSDQGDEINLKSKLSQFVALAKLFHENTIENLKLRLSNRQDVWNTIEYLESGC